MTKISEAMRTTLVKELKNKGEIIVNSKEGIDLKVPTESLDDTISFIKSTKSGKKLSLTHNPSSDEGHTIITIWEK